MVPPIKTSTVGILILAIKVQISVMPDFIKYGHARIAMQATTLAT
jgi:hypothetical protein